MRMKTLAAAVGVALLTILPVGPAVAQSLAGNYLGSGGSTMSISEIADGRYRVKMEIGAPRCGGAVDATGRMRGDSLVASPSGSGAACTLTIRRRGAALSVSENNCMSFHGASCEFEGIYQRRSR